jgi:sugar O-acyltransferase (sialic acid O-acetyltransferase NeuD family)
MDHGAANCRGWWFYRGCYSLSRRSRFFKAIMKVENLIIISAGKFGREVYGWAQHSIRAGAGWKFKGFLDDRADALDGLAYEGRILGTVQEYQPASDDVFIGAIGDPREKQKYYNPILEKGGRFTNLIHPLSCIGQNVRLGHGVVLAPFTCLTSDVTVGNFVSFGTYSGAGHDTVIGDWSQVCGHCGINGNAILETGVFLGSHTAILPYVKVGAWSYVGAGSVVIKRVRPGIKVFGNPAVAFDTVG